MEERVEISLLLDFYGSLLTDKQRDIMTMYYNEDLSLAEIAELNNTSRQAIHDTIKRCQRLLLDYENKLQIMTKNFILSDIKKKLLIKCSFLKDKISDSEIKTHIEYIEKDIIENL
ncbi:putative DNA-binding protein [Clostridium swellfunianum]|uniref:putative DNA-binding protein n=1 Tax=Clostridium swellfunianum TaxID=1367462 RepID=UPI00202F948B|nr:putative DNA-binding protein [Clostridium swellfunianum]MCM0648699.1 putative DNA-binding protein [Clostridium swellfunianum]